MTVFTGPPKPRITDQVTLRKAITFIEASSGQHLTRLANTFNEEFIEMTLIQASTFLNYDNRRLELVKDKSTTAIIWTTTCNARTLAVIAYYKENDPDNQTDTKMFRIDVVDPTAMISIEEELALLAFLARGIRRVTTLPIHACSPRSNTLNWDEIAEVLNEGYCSLNSDGVITFGLNEKPHP